MFLCGISYAIAGYFQIQMEAGQTLNIAWMALPYSVLTVAEILVSTTALEFAYTQAPREMKSVVQSLYLLTTAIANFAVSIMSRLQLFKGAGQFFFYGSLAVLAGVAIFLVARRFKVRDYFQTATPSVPTTQRESVGVAAKTG
jgi:POT family proton-dependent oligopeptide transporter